VIVVTSLYFHK